jgi:Na+/H+-dicarboxylate symporter
MLKGMILPLIVPALIYASGSLDLSLSAKIGLRVIAYYMATTVLAVFEGIALVSLIQPGTRSSDVFESAIIPDKNVTNVDMLMDLIRNLFPPNIFQAMLEKSQTVLIYPGKTDLNDSVLEDDKLTWTFEEKWTSGTNILGLIIVSMVCA